MLAQTKTETVRDAAPVTHAGEERCGMNTDCVEDVLTTSSCSVPLRLLVYLAEHETLYLTRLLVLE